LVIAFLVVIQAWRKRGYKAAEGLFFLFCTLGGLGIILWFLWNKLIFGDALYFALGPYSAHAQQQQLAQAGDLVTKGDWLTSFKTYFYALFYNSNTVISLFGFFGAIVYWFDKKVTFDSKLASVALLAPLFFNVLALYLGFSVVFIQGISGNTWFNVRYGVMVIPFIAVFAAFLVSRFSSLKWVLIGLFIFITFFQFNSVDAVTLEESGLNQKGKIKEQLSVWLCQYSRI
jgi:hypothetical protein